MQAVAQRRTAAVVAGRSRASDFAFDAATHHAGAGDRFLVRHAHADGAFDLARNLLGYALGVLLSLLAFNALIRAHLDLLLTPFVAAHRYFALDLLFAANALANLHLAAFVLRAVHPHLASAGAAVAGVARVIAAAVTMTAEQAAAAGLTGFPVAQALQVLLGDGLFDVAPHFLADFPFFIDGSRVANFANFFLDNRNALHADDGPFLLHRNGLATEAFNGFLFALDPVHRALDGVGLWHTFIRPNGPSRRTTRVAARRRTAIVSPSG